MPAAPAALLGVPIRPADSAYLASSMVAVSCTEFPSSLAAKPTRVAPP